jgi:blue copper oxidase
MRRRDFLKTIGAGAFIAPSLASILSSCDSTIVEPPGSQTMTLSNGMAQLGTGLNSPAILTNDAFLGPTIRVRKGDSFSLKFQNNLAEESNVHWHGLTVPAKMDGHPMDAVGAGSSFIYAFDVIDRPGTYWYHAHPDLLTAKQAYMGHAGFFIVGSAEEDALGLPTGANDIPLLIQDKRLGASGEMIYAPKKLDKLIGWLGSDILINGKKDATQSVAQEVYRLRLLNGSNARVYKVGFADGKTFHLIGNDGSLIDAAVPVDHVFLSSGERADILVDFSNDAMGSNRMLKSLPFPFESQHQSFEYPQGAEYDLIQFTIDRPKQHNFTIPTVLLPYEKLSESQAVKTRQFQLTMDHDVERGMHRINNILFDMHRIDYPDIKLGDIEIWEFENQGDSLHNMHVHGTQFQVLDRSFNAANLAPTDKGWKDTVIIWPNDYVRILVRFNKYKGVYLLHCHNLEHEDDGMMVNLEVI